MTSIQNGWEVIRSSLWFLPSVMATAALALALAMLAIDRSLGSGESTSPWLYPGGPDGARGVLTAIAGSMVTVAGVVFSVTIVALTLASQQFGPRLLRRFLRDRGNQAVIGTFVAVFVYCLVVLRTVHGDGPAPFVPDLSVSVAVLLATSSAGVLIYFIHHAARSLQASTVISAICKEFLGSRPEIFPGPIGTDGPEGEHSLPSDFLERSVEVAASRSGYVQAFKHERLMCMARKRNLMIHLERRPGDFVLAGCPILKVWPMERAAPDLLSALSMCVIVGDERTEQQDVRFAFAQLTEIGVRALSPSLHDPFTAIECLDRLTSMLRYFAELPVPSPFRLERRDGSLRIVAAPVRLVEIVEATLPLFIQHGRSHPGVLLGVLDCIRQVAPAVRSSPERTALGLHARRVSAAAAEGLPSYAARERGAIDRHLRQVLHALEERQRNAPGQRSESRSGESPASSAT